MSTLGAIEELVSWSKSNGALLSENISFKQISRGNIGAFYGNSYKEDAKLEGNQIRLPVKLVMALSDAIESFQKESEGDFKAISLQTSNINSLFKLYLARERSSKYLASSFYKPYLQLLPTLKEINSPYCWTADDIALLKGTNLGNSLRENIGQLVEEWWQVINLLPESVEKPEAHYINMKFYYEYKFYKDEDFYNYFVIQNENDVDNWTSFPNYLWASLILKSRSFPAYLLKSAVEAHYKRDEAMLLPLVDLLNHDSKANVSWSVFEDKYFNFKSDSVVPNSQLYNNYGLKGNEELLLAYGFCIDDNASDSVALKIKIPEHLMSELQKNNIKLPTIDDYTTSVVRSDDEKRTKENEYDDGVLFFITNENLPENLLQVFQFLVKNKWENNGITLRMKLAGLNQLRQALESKNNLLNADIVSKSDNAATIKIYIQSQRKIYLANIKKIKRLEKELLSDTANKPHLVTLKNVFKKDRKFQQSLLVSLGVSSYDEIVNSQFSDQAWLLYLIRCYNRDEYVNPNESDSFGDEDNYLPKWIKNAFLRVEKEEGEPSAAEVVQYKDLYLGLIPQLAEIVPEIYNKGKWRVQELIRSAKLLDTISFVRGKQQECILVESA